MTVRTRDILTLVARAADVGMARPELTAELTALASHRIATLAGHTAGQTREATYVSLLRYGGCTSDAKAGASLIGNEIEMNRAIHGKVHHTEPSEMLAFLWEWSGDGGRGLPARLAQFATVLSRLPGMLHTAAAHCEVNDDVAKRLGLDASCREALRHGFEGWNGSGLPSKLRGPDIAIPARVAMIADELVPVHRIGGSEAIRDVALRRAGRAFDPTLASLVADHADELAELLSVPSPAAALGDLDLRDEPLADAGGIESLCEVMADFADLKCEHTRGSSRAVAALAVRAASMLRVPADQRDVLRRAALLHAVGRVGITVRIWTKPGPLHDAEWVQVRRHTLLTERVLRNSPFLAEEAELACVVQERLDGSGYHRRLPPAALTVVARVLAAADVFHALCSTRPHRDSLSPARAAEVLRSEVKAGRIAGDAAEAVIAAAGERPRFAVAAPRGLTEREVEVLRLMARGLTNKQIAEALGIARKTAGNHVQNVLGKVGVSTRAAAAMFAMQAGLVS